MQNHYTRPEKSSHFDKRGQGRGNVGNGPAKVTHQPHTSGIKLAEAFTRQLTCI